MKKDPILKVLEGKKKPCPMKDRCKYYQPEAVMCNETGGSWGFGYKCGILKNKTKFHLNEMGGDEDRASNNKN